MSHRLFIIFMSGVLGEARAMYERGGLQMFKNGVVWWLVFADDRLLMAESADLRIMIVPLQSLSAQRVGGECNIGRL